MDIPNKYQKMHQYSFENEKLLKDTQDCVCISEWKKYAWTTK